MQAHSRDQRGPDRCSGRQRSTTRRSRNVDFTVALAIAQSIPPSWWDVCPEQPSVLEGGVVALLDGRTALVTGSARGLGRDYVTGLAADGANVVVADIDGQGAEQTAKTIAE
ncbi:MAG TPA: SDR family NAD(P)-dependent oxidoreductase, partial [Mycobacterium sp.]|nr:SDR family NAD(P)-dependent oxidoreductase [Mycobacterium sp.]